MKRLIKFQKDNCNPCNMVSAKLEKEGIQYEAINAFDEPLMASKWKVRSVPTLLLIDGDTEVKRIIGYKPEEIETLKELL